MTKIGRILHCRALVSVTCSGFGQFHRIIVGLRRDYGAVVKIFIFFLEKSRY
jgi:hypothetical protein